MGGTDGELENIDLSRALHDYFRLGDDIEAIYTELRRDPVVARAVEQYAGLRLLRQEPWECLVSYVCSRVKSIRVTRSSVKAIATLSRDTVRLEGDVRHVFPAAQNPAMSGQRGILNSAGAGCATSSSRPGRANRVRASSRPAVTNEKLGRRLRRHRPSPPEPGPSSTTGVRRVGITAAGRCGVAPFPPLLRREEPSLPRTSGLRSRSERTPFHRANA